MTKQKKHYKDMEEFNELSVKLMDNDQSDIIMYRCTNCNEIFNKDLIFSELDECINCGMFSLMAVYEE